MKFRNYSTESMREMIPPSFGKKCGQTTKNCFKNIFPIVTPPRLYNQAIFFLFRLFDVRMTDKKRKVKSLFPQRLHRTFFRQAKGFSVHVNFSSKNDLTRGH